MVVVASGAPGVPVVCWAWATDIARTLAVIRQRASDVAFMSAILP
jgi:hypothetical protein